MRIAVLNGNPRANGGGFDDYVGRLADTLRSNSHEVDVLPLRDMDIKPCAGCLECWTKSPGLCKIDDDSHDVCRSYINSDLVLFASPIMMGFTSALLKRATDKLVPLLPYHIELVEGEMHHAARYDRYPRMALLLETEVDTDDEDMAIISDIYARDALNLKSSLAFTRLVSDPVEEVAREADRL
jgi:multimeric flavodoxin WrbA